VSRRPCRVVCALCLQTFLAKGEDVDMCEDCRDGQQYLFGLAAQQPPPREKKGDAA